MSEREAPWMSADHAVQVRGDWNLTEAGLTPVRRKRPDFAYSTAYFALSSQAFLHAAIWLSRFGAVSQVCVTPAARAIRSKRVRRSG